jgi:putative endonuclease
MKHCSMPKVFTSEKQKIGEIGEEIAVEFLNREGFFIKDRNYTKRWGEIDIVAQKGNNLYFVEVKSVSRAENVTHGTNSEYRAEDNMHPWKLKRLSRTIQTYLLDRNIDDDVDWQVDLMVVYLDMKTNTSQIKVVSDIIL